MSKFSRRGIRYRIYIYTVYIRGVIYRGVPHGHMVRTVHINCIIIIIIIATQGRVVYGERRHAEPPGGNDHPQLTILLSGRSRIIALRRLLQVSTVLDTT
jgi:hypothetical protein